MSKEAVIQRIKESGVVPVIRASSKDEARKVIDALAEGGIATVEITLTIPDACELIADVRRDYGDQLTIGGGTVLDKDAAARCIQAGAEFIVSPALDIETVIFCNSKSIAVMPGALTPTEIVAAWNAGADVVKVFPVSAMGGPGYLKALKAPLPEIPLMPTGGVSVSNIGDFLRAGAEAVGVGGELVDVTAVREGHPERITATARNFVAAVKSTR